MRSEIIKALGLDNLTEENSAGLLPFKGMKETESMKEYERQWIENGHPIPPSAMLEPGTIIHTEAVRLERERDEKERG